MRVKSEYSAAWHPRQHHHPILLVPGMPPPPFPVLCVQGVPEGGALPLAQQRSSWPLVLLSGLGSIALAFTILALFPSSALWVLGLIVGLDFVATGLSLLSTSLLASWGARRRPKAP